MFEQQSLLQFPGLDISSKIVSNGRENRLFMTGQPQDSNLGLINWFPNVCLPKDTRREKKVVLPADETRHIATFESDNIENLAVLRFLLTDVAGISIANGSPVLDYLKSVRLENGLIPKGNNFSVGGFEFTMPENRYGFNIEDAEPEGHQYLMQTTPHFMFKWPRKNFDRPLYVEETLKFTISDPDRTSFVALTDVGDNLALNAINILPTKAD